MAETAPLQAKYWFAKGLMMAGYDPVQLLAGAKFRTGRLGWSEWGQEVPYAGYFKQGGLVRQTGLAYVHKGEEIVPKEKREESQPKFEITFNIKAWDSQDVDRTIRRKITPQLEDLIKRYSHLRYTIKDV